MSHFSDIGFHLENEDELYALAEQVYPKCKAYPCKKGTYLAYRDPSGAELWLQVNTQKELVGVDPHFVGNSRIHAAVSAEINREISELDASLHLWVEPQDSTRPESGLYPMVVDMAGYQAHPIVEFPSLKYLQVSAFADDLQIFESEEAYYANQEEGAFKMAAQSFIPAGLFGSKEEKDFVPQALATFTGKITLSESRTNTFTGHPFHYFQVETFGGKYDVVADPSEWHDLPPVGGIATGQFWLSGSWADAPILEELPPFRKKWYRKIFTYLFSKMG